MSERQKQNLGRTWTGLKISWTTAVTAVTAHQIYYYFPALNQSFSMWKNTEENLKLSSRLTERVETVRVNVHNMAKSLGRVENNIRDLRNDIRDLRNDMNHHMKEQTRLLRVLVGEPPVQSERDLPVEKPVQENGEHGSASK